MDMSYCGQLKLLNELTSLKTPLKKSCLVCESVGTPNYETSGRGLPDRF